MDFVATGALFLSAIGLLIAYFAMPRENREDMLAFLQRAFGAAKTTVSGCLGFLALLLPFLVVLTSFYGIWLFYSSEEPIRRGEVIIVGLHMINSLFYIFISAKVVSMALKERNPQNLDNAVVAPYEKIQQ